MSEYPGPKRWEVVVYATVGFLLDGPARAPVLVEKGRTIVRNARFLGELVVRESRNQFQVWLDQRSGRAAEAAPQNPQGDNGQGG